MTLIKESKKKDFIDKYLLNDVIFTALILFMTFLTSVPYLQYHLNKYYKFILAYGVLVVLWALITGKLIPLIWKRKSNLLLVAFSASYLITIFVNRDSYLVENLKQLAYMVTFFILLYIMQQGKTKEQIVKQIKAFSAIIVGVTFILANICYQMYLKGFTYTYVCEGTKYLIGYDTDYSTLWGLYNPNTCGTFCAVSILMSVSFIVYAFTKRAIYRNQLMSKVFIIVFNLYNIFIEICCLVPTGSRTSEYSLYIAMILFLLLSLISFFKRIPISSTSLNTIFFVPQLLRTSVDADKGLPVIIAFLQKIVGNLSGRDEIWVQGWDVFLTSPILGVTSLNIENLSNELSEKFSYKSVIDLDAGGLHNIYLTVLVSTGILGLALILLFFGIQVTFGLKHALQSNGLWQNFVVSFIIMILASEFFEARILFSVTFVSIVFWLYMGYQSALLAYKRN